MAVHVLCAEKGRTVKNTHHYRDHAQRIVDLEQAIAALIPHETAAALCAVLKRTSPRIYKDQHVAVRALLRDHQLADNVFVTDLSQSQELTASTNKRHLETKKQAKQRGHITPSSDSGQIGKENISTTVTNRNIVLR